MRLTKSDILDSFDREDRSYRLAILCSDWLRDTAQFKPNAATQARGSAMKIRDKWILFADLAKMLEQQTQREVITADFILNQLHALIRAPFELLRDYCEDFDKAVPTLHLQNDLKNTAWYYFTKLIRNAISHNFRFEFNKQDKWRLPVTWNGITITPNMDGEAITYEALWHNSGYALFLEMRVFAEALPEPPK